jgi:hypothetical protein
MMRAEAATYYVHSHTSTTRFWVRAFGGRSQVYFNLCADANWNRYIEVAAKLAFPHAIMVGGAVLVGAGYTKQRTGVTDLAIAPETATYSIDGFQLHARRRAWFVCVSMGIRGNQRGFARLRAHWALADSVLARGAQKKLCALFSDA